VWYDGLSEGRFPVYGNLELCWGLVYGDVQVV
jgi:hypothetical protein